MDGAAATAARQLGSMSLGESSGRANDEHDDDDDGFFFDASSEHHYSEAEEEAVGGTATAAQLLGSVLLGEPGERKDDDTEPTAKNGTPTKMCSACGKKSNTLKLCPWCQCVRYCDGDCQNEHHSEHRKECNAIKEVLDKRGGKLDLGTEKDVGPLPDLPPRDECPICMCLMPLHTMLHAYYTCCGNTICGGCNLQHLMKNEESTCAFCREPIPTSDEQYLVRLHKRVELKDPKALCNLAMNYVDGLRGLMGTYYGYGDLGLQVDQAKCVELLRQSADLGFPEALYNLGVSHYVGEMGLEENEEEALKYCEQAAEGGILLARHDVGSMKAGNGDDVVAGMPHWRLAASGGYRSSMRVLIQYCFEDGLLRHADLAETLQAFYRSRSEMKSEDRDEYIKHLKEIGEYEEEYE